MAALVPEFAMSLMIYPVLVTTATVTAATLLVYLNRPVLVVQMYMKFAVLFSGMKIQYVKLGDLTLCYGERGRKRPDKSSILLLHGFSADKFMWVPLVKNLTDYHVIALDLPGHGDSDIPSEGEDISFNGQVSRVREFVEAVGLDKTPFHMVGMSMGGSIAGLYTAKYPDQIERLSMMCPAMKTPIDSEVSIKIREIMETQDDETILRECPFIPKNPEEMKYMLGFAQFYKPNFFFTNKILQGAVEMRKPNNIFFFRLFKSLASWEYAAILENTAHKITVPSQLIWGEEDQVIDVSGVKVLQEKLPNCQSVDIISRCGHAINLDRPGSKTKAILKFRGELKTKQS
ncbi:monoacylglycerol lipase ABHD6-like [Mizuhopecten yessoensis]|uniref:acylglycerol lipase n=1 Tax=Mizuhopecten yessoensis TaxID=6573 RepID=A0A210QYJ7_MIZYE|nr:monoacylglycerol lipase ABHD6-like [Mizuhopecten yessoensis]OWF53810.1 Monoacylglycerol lipase ABHD6 [Mizuhopecten yessoensis]